MFDTCRFFMFRKQYHSRNVKMSMIHIVFGRQGAGKSTYSMAISKERNGVHLSIDEWMSRLFGRDLPKPLNLRWIMERVERCEEQIWEVTKQIANCGVQVVLDLGFTKVENRRKFIGLAKEEGIAVKLHYIKAPHLERRSRVLHRNVEKGETFSFEVTAEMFDFMESEFEVPSTRELEDATIIDTSMRNDNV